MVSTHSWAVTGERHRDSMGVPPLGWAKAHTFTLGSDSSLECLPPVLSGIHDKGPEEPSCLTPTVLALEDSQPICPSPTEGIWSRWEAPAPEADSFPPSGPSQPSHQLTRASPSSLGDGECTATVKDCACPAWRRQEEGVPAAMPEGSPRLNLQTPRGPTIDT